MTNVPIESGTATTFSYAGVHILDIPYSADRMYDYYIPAEMRDKALPGSFVIVPFGSGNRRRSALIAELHADTDAKKPKPLLSVSEDSTPLNAEQLGMCLYLAANTLCTVGDALHAIIPSGSAKSVKLYSATGKELPSDGGEFTPGALIVYEYIKQKDHVKEELLRSKFGAQVKDTLKLLISWGYLESETEISDSSIKFEKFYSLALSKEDAEKVLDGGRTAKMKRKLTLPSQLDLRHYADSDM